ncbi:MAG: hypothetical protein A2096_07440 [Spirochaetes bacterium GWF1_41_5]|nr:MAG: hypothetical protein A2096_07440 [Spirochaetes bacterium GWF1_41_5]HBE02393.1 hypothetical protein [Spirochaetia bacterium]
MSKPFFFGFDIRKIFFFAATIALCRSQNLPPDSEELKLLENSELEEQREFIKNYNRKKIIRPRAASLDHNYLLFEAREYRDQTARIWLILYDTVKLEKISREIPSIRNRSAELAGFYSNYNLVDSTPEASGFSPEVCELSLAPGIILQYSIVPLFSAFYRLNIFLAADKKICLLANFVLESPAGKPEIRNLYRYNAEAAAVKYRTGHLEKNDYCYTEDVFVFKIDSSVFDKRRIKAADEFRLAQEQNKIIFLTEKLYDIYSREISRTVYFLSGKKTHLPVK